MASCAGRPSSLVAWSEEDLPGDGQTLGGSSQNHQGLRRSGPAESNRIRASTGRSSCDSERLSPALGSSFSLHLSQSRQVSGLNGRLWSAAAGVHGVFTRGKN